MAVQATVTLSRKSIQYGVPAAELLRRGCFYFRCEPRPTPMLKAVRTKRNNCRISEIDIGIASLRRGKSNLPLTEQYYIICFCGCQHNNSRKLQKALDKRQDILYNYFII